MNNFTFQTRSELGETRSANFDLSRFSPQLAGEINQNGRADTKWVQAALNQVMGLRLTVDGILGAQTRSAIRSFQQRQGLVADGIAGPRTKAALAAALAGRSVPVGQTQTTTVQQGPVIFGLDTYELDGNKNPNWAQAKAEGSISFAIIRSNYGTWQDSRFKYDWPKMKEAGIVRGGYLFLRFPHPKNNMSVPDPVSQAKAVIKTMPNLENSDLPPTIDVEFPGDKRYPHVNGRKLTGMTAQQVLDGVRAAWKVLKDYYHVPPIIYTSGRVWHEDLDDLPAPEIIESPLWLARYPFSKGPAVQDSRVSRLNPPPVPRPWGDATNWWIHQYQGDARGLPGFHQVDLNRFNTMSKGASGDRVKWVQRRLGIPQTGQFDDSMDRMLRAFQSKRGLNANGMIDPGTFAYLCWSNP